jgi:hypothetical protein
MAIFNHGDRAQLTTAARATGRFGPGVELGTVCRSCNPGARNVKVLWDTHGSRDGLYYARGLIEPAGGGGA